MNPTIRPIEEKDNLPLAQMIREVFIEHDAPKKGTVYSDPTTDNLFDLFQTKKAVLWVLEINQKAIGCCGIFPTKGLPDKCVELVKFYISNEARGKGFGLELLNKCFDSANKLEYDSMYIESLPEYAKAVNMYIQAGFTQLSQPMGNSGHSACNLWFLKKL